MWRLVRAEFIHHKYLFLVSFGLAPLAIAYDVLQPARVPPSGILIWLLMFLTVNTWVSLRA